MNDSIHSCGYFCLNPACILAQRDQLVAKYIAQPASPVQASPVTNADIDAAREALDSLDDFSRMTVGVNAIGPRGVLERFIANVAALKAQPEQSASAWHKDFLIPKDSI